MKNTIGQSKTKDIMTKMNGDKQFKSFSESANLKLQLAVEIYNARIKINLTQQSLAKKAQTTQKVISKIENGDVNIGIELLNKIAKILHFDDTTFAGIFNCPITINEFKFDTFKSETAGLKENNQSNQYTYN